MKIDVRESRQTKTLMTKIDQRKQNRKIKKYYDDLYADHAGFPLQPLLKIKDKQ